MTLSLALWMLVAFQAKHLVCDFLLQTPYMYANKGRYGHPGGLLHAGLHGAGTLLLLLLFSVAAWPAAVLSLAETVFHYHVDWTKEKLSAFWHLTPDRSGYWTLLGLDQTVHQLTYVALVALAAAVG